MRKASILASSSSLSKSLLKSSQQQHINLFHTASVYATFNSASSRRLFSTSKLSSDFSRASKFSLSLGAFAAASVVAGTSLLLVEQEAYAKELVKPDLAFKDVVLYQYEACPFCNKVKGIV